jgi:rhodanese-related sulfurtransferase
MKSLLTVITLLTCGTAFAQSDEITPVEFRRLMEEDKSVVILDVRTAEEVESGVIGNPVVIDYFKKDFKAKIKELDTSKTYLVYCATGFRSSETVLFMKKSGFKKVYNLSGGLQNWKKSKMPVQKF